MKQTKKAQIFSIDMIIAVTIFLIGLIIFFRYGSQIYYKNTANSMNTEAEELSNKIISSGSPKNWSELNLSNDKELKSISAIGICNDGTNIVNNSKLEKLIQLSNKNYKELKFIEKARYNFVIELPRANITIGDKSYKYQEANNIITITRIVAINNSLEELKVIVFN